MKPSIKDIPLYTFFVQVSFTFILIFFCMLSMTFPQKGTQKNQALYASLISFLTGFWMPSPASKSITDSQVAIDSEETNVVMSDKNE